MKRASRTEIGTTEKAGRPRVPWVRVRDPRGGGLIGGQVRCDRRGVRERKMGFLEGEGGG